MNFQPSIKSFYRNASVLVTGGSGFIGKVLLEKLLRSCDVECIYVLLRSKRGLSSEERYHELIQNPVFDRIRESNLERFQKIKLIGGDISQENIGVSNSDLQTLIETVNVVFNSAADIRFDNTIKEALNLNTLSSKRLWDLCSQMKNLQSVVHVSTAYSNPARSYVGEQVYPPKVPMDLDTFLKCADVLPDNLVQMIATHLEGEHPNTYTITKLMAEQMAAEYHHKLPISIVRPSIVTCSLAEPFPGWVDNTNTVNGIFTGVSLGTVRSYLWSDHVNNEYIPVDVVSNMMITAAWLNHFKPNPSCIRVYNCTSGTLNPLDWQMSFQYVVKYSRKYPSKYTVMYPNANLRLNRFVHFFYETFLHFLPAHLIDFVFRCKGMKPFMYENAKRLKENSERYTFFRRQKYHFEAKTVEELLHEVSNANDGDEFMCDVRQLNLDEYFEIYVCGIRKYILKDDQTTMEYARRKLDRLYFLKLFSQTIIFGTTGFVIYEILLYFK